MKTCKIFLSKEENYFKTALKIKKFNNINTEIIWLEDFLPLKNKKELLENSIIYFLCNKLTIIRKIIEISKDVHCYIFNKDFFKKNYTKIEIQEILEKNNIKVPKRIDISKLEDIKLPVFCKENNHTGIVFKAYTENTLKNFFEKFDKNRFYIEESVNGGIETKYYYVKGNIYSKNNSKIEEEINKSCTKISELFNLEVFSIDCIKQNETSIVIDLNPSAGFYLQDEARNSLINEFNKIEL